MERPRSGARRPGDDLERLFDRVSSIAAVGLGPALDQVADHIREFLPVDVVLVQATDEYDPEDVARGYSLGGDEAARSLRSLLTPTGADPFGLADAAIDTGSSVRWSRLWAGPTELARLERAAEDGVPAGAIHNLTSDANGVAVPLRTIYHPSLGAVSLLNLGHDNPVPDRYADELEALAPELSLAVRNHQLAARSQRTRRVLEAVIGSSRLGLVVSDLRGRITVANETFAQLVETPRDELTAMPIRKLVSERLKWRFTNPDEFESRVLPLYDDPTVVDESYEDAVNGQIVKHYSGPATDDGGAVLGRVEVFTDVTVAQEALRAARRLAEERVELLEREEKRAQEEVALTRAGHLMASAMSRDDIHEHLLEQAEALVHCDKSAVLVVDSVGNAIAATSRGFAEETVKKMIFAAGEGIVGRVLENRRPFICNDTASETRLTEGIVVPEGIRSFIHMPLVLGERNYGLFSVNSTEPRSFGERELRVLTELARHATAALQNALQFEQERHIAETLQQALLTETLPSIPGLELAALYQASPGTAVGGDLYNVWTLPDGRCAVLVGDVSGKGVEAASVTAMVRHMADAISQSEQRPGPLLGRLNDLLVARLPASSLVTLVLAVIDPDADELLWCCAGHPPPMVVDVEGRVRVLDHHDPPCGAFRATDYAEHTEPFRAGESLFLYTDGLIEARRNELFFGEAGVEQALAEAFNEPPATLARSVYSAARLWCSGKLTDDVAIAVVRRADASDTGSMPRIR